jgi:hypothetical protein
VSRRISILPAAALIVVALAVAAFAFSGWRTTKRSGVPRLGFTSHNMQLSQTQPDQALIRLPNAKPGQVARGSTQLSVTGARASVLAGATNLQETPGANGGSLIASNRLWIAVSCTGGTCPANGPAYIGPLKNMGTRSLGIWPPGTHRTYTVRVWLRRGQTPPSTTTGDNAFQGSRAKFGLLWSATATASGSRD